MWVETKVHGGIRHHNTSTEVTVVVIGGVDGRKKEIILNFDIPKKACPNVIQCMWNDSVLNLDQLDGSCISLHWKENWLLAGSEVIFHFLCIAGISEIFIASIFKMNWEILVSDITSSDSFKFMTSALRNLMRSFIIWCWDYCCKEEGMDGSCMEARKWIQNLLEIPNGRKHLRGHGVGERITLKLILKKYVIKMWTVLDLPRILSRAKINTFIFCNYKCNIS